MLSGSRKVSVMTIIPYFSRAASMALMWKAFWASSRLDAVRRGMSEPVQYQSNSMFWGENQPITDSGAAFESRTSEHTHVPP